MAVTFWFDPSCPYTWRTARWLRETAAERGEEVRWRLMSLAVLNADEDLPADHREPMRRGATVSRVLAAAEAGHGNGGLDALYTALGRRVHDQGAPLDRGTVAAAVAEAGLPERLLAAYDDEARDDAVRDSHEDAQQRVGQDAGSPVVAFGDGPGFFGPIVTHVPTGDEARRLWEATELLSTVPHFSELKRARRPA